MLPYTDEQVMANSTDDLVKDLLEQQKNELHIEFERKKWKKIEKDAERYQNFQYEILDEFRDIISQADLTVTKLEMNDEGHIFFVDTH